MAKPKGQEMVVIFKNESNPQHLADKMDSFINNLSVDKKGFIEALSNDDKGTKEKFSKICLLWIKKMNFYYEKQWYDLRNEYSIQTANKISKILGSDLEEFMPTYKGFVNTEDYYEEEDENEEDVFEIDFVEAMAKTHRTLQQTFSEIVFHWLLIMGEGLKEDEFYANVSTKIKNGLDGDFYRTPFI